MTADSTAGQPLVVGVDFGTLSARAVVVRASDGAELGTGVSEYAHGSIERTLPFSPGARNIGSEAGRASSWPLSLM